MAKNVIKYISIYRVYMQHLKENKEEKALALKLVMTNPSKGVFSYKWVRTK